MKLSVGKRVKKDAGERRGKKPGLVLVLVPVLVLVLAAGYVGLCVRAGSGSTYLPHTTIAGVDVGGLTAEQAAAALEDQLPDLLANYSVEFTCEGNTYQISGSDAAVDVDTAVQQVLEEQSGSFLTSGVRYLAALVGSSRYSVPVSLGASPAAVQQAVQECADPESQTTWEVQTDTLVFHKGVTGRTIDTAALVTALEERLEQLLAEDESADYAPIVAEVVTAPPSEPNYEAIHAEVYVEAADAYLDKETVEIVPSVTGVDFDIDAARAAVDAAEEGAEISVPLILTEPSITTANLEANLFKDVLAQSSTVTAGGTNRWHNVELACERVNGTILLPGEIFSYNELCGPYSEAGGYLKAGAYVSGTTQDTWAGGVCQLSSTIYWTTLKANLETVERNKHKYDVGYLPSGMDATVYSDSLDFKFKNDTDYPIKIVTSLTNSGGTRYCNVTIYGTNTTGIYGDPYSVVLSTIAPQTLYEPSDSVPQGSAPQLDSTRTAYTGKTVEVHQRLRDASGTVISDTVIHTDTFSARDAVYFYNPADAARLGIDTSTGLMTLTPVTPTPTATPTPTVTPTPTPEATATPEASAEPSAAPTATPTPAPEATATPEASAEPSSGPGMEPVDEAAADSSASPSE